MLSQKRVFLLYVMLVAILGFAGCSGSSGSTDAGTDGGGLPQSLPFSLTRPAVGSALTAGEISTFTAKITGFWKQVDYFDWTFWHSHGLDKSYDPDMPDYKVWWQDTRAIKTGDTITFSHVGGADNLMIRTSKVLAQAIASYLMSDDELMGKIVEQYSKGTVALFQGMLWGPNDPDPYITARAIFTHNHSYTDEQGRKVAVDYDPVKNERYDWNAHTVPNNDNPLFGPIWVRNMRSKDDLPHMFRVAPLLLRVVEKGKDESVRQAAQIAYDYLQGFAKDIVDHGYEIRTKEDGVAYVPKEEEYPDVTKDLASFVVFDAVIPNAECDPKLTSALLAYGDAQGNDCGNGISSQYETVAVGGHYFNYAIVRYFHLTAIVNALTIGENEIAEELLDGLVERVDIMTADEEERADHQEWDSD
ncbi:MAG: hypothetical protein JRJ19_05530, partial [Deltaproteobacteria bacterium]|nr:hypothetical protein [Deltaproteobacteria bacterium]